MTHTSIPANKMLKFMMSSAATGIRMGRMWLHMARLAWSLVFNPTTLLWVLKACQHVVVDPTMEFLFGVRTLNGTQAERKARYSAQTKMKRSNPSFYRKLTGSDNAGPLEFDPNCKFEMSAQLVTVWCGISALKTKNVDNKTDDEKKQEGNNDIQRDTIFLSEVFYTHNKYIHPSILLHSDHVTMNGKTYKVCREST